MKNLTKDKRRKESGSMCVCYVRIAIIDLYNHSKRCLVIGGKQGLYTYIYIYIHICIHIT